jgi:hypothetical protein
VVVIVTRRQEGGVEPDVAAVGGDAEAQRVAVERDRSIEVRDAEVDVADADGGMDGLGVHAGQSRGRAAARHRCVHLSGPRGRARESRS